MMDRFQRYHRWNRLNREFAVWEVGPQEAQVEWEVIQDQVDYDSTLFMWFQVLSEQLDKCPTPALQKLYDAHKPRVRSEINKISGWLTKRLQQDPPGIQGFSATQFRALCDIFDFLPIDLLVRLAAETSPSPVKAKSLQGIKTAKMALGFFGSKFAEDVASLERAMDRFSLVTTPSSSDSSPRAPALIPTHPLPSPPNTISPGSQELHSSPPTSLPTFDQQQQPQQLHPSPPTSFGQHQQQQVPPVQLSPPTSIPTFNPQQQQMQQLTYITPPRDPSTSLHPSPPHVPYSSAPAAVGYTTNQPSISYPFQDQPQALPQNQVFLHDPRGLGAPAIAPRQSFSNLYTYANNPSGAPTHGNPYSSFNPSQPLSDPVQRNAYDHSGTLQSSNQAVGYHFSAAPHDPSQSLAAPTSFTPYLNAFWPV
ncbi:hypothetical protein BT69DRAFT_76919 [Atractiella rhizophila]|nr:hypothetical protein BT69DRAFT_76919 [Atractiella rhizophila]